MATPKTPAPAVAPSVTPPPKSDDFGEALVKPTVIMTEADAYIHERVGSQPASLEEVRQTVVHVDTEKNRLSLPDYFERFSYDCTQGRGCKAHNWVYDEASTRWSYSNRGEFVFHWTKKVKRSIDHAMNVAGWFFVNRRYFPDAPTHLFSANGGVELGDVILFFLPAKQGLLLRNAPGKRSTEILRSRLTRTPEGSVAMTGNLDNTKYYVPKSGAESDDETTTPGLQEDRDF